MTKDKKHIVLLTTWYPPLQGIAVSRMEAFVKYLDHAKFKITVVTIGDAKIFGLSEEEHATIYRIKPLNKIWSPQFRSSDSKIWHYTKVAWKKAQMKLKGDENDFYTKAAITFLDSLQKKEPIDLVISSFSPAAPHVAASQICSSYGIKWIVDMRDEMSLNPQSDTSTRNYYTGIEKEINKHATALIAVSEPIVDYFKTVIPDLKAYVEVRNGFDHELEINEYNFNETFTLLHAGSFYGIRKPDTLLKALQNLNEKKWLPEKWKFVCAGAVKNFSIPDSIKGHIEIVERVSHQESLEMMAAADLNILIQPPTGRKGVYTGKLFEYISVQKPILALVDPDDVAADLIREFKAGSSVLFSDIDRIEAALVMIIDLWQKKTRLNANVERITKLHRKYQVQKLNLLIENILNEK